MNDTPQTIAITEFHWLMDMLQNIDAGLVVLDREYRVRVWNGFMHNHSGIFPDRAQGRSLFELFPDLPEAWLRHKAETVFSLNIRAFMVWEQRPYLFRFRNYRPITGTAEFMYQNVTLLPLASSSGEIEHVGLIVYDVTDVAVGKLALTRANAELEQLSRTDALTGLNNRGYFEACLNTEFRRFQRTAAIASLVMFDVDHFKRFNDTHGHQAGDEVLRVVARLLGQTVRDTDIPGRYGGEEFGVVLVNTGADAARYFAERLRRRIEQTVVSYEGLSLSVTISLGIAELDASVDSAHAWIERADLALYRSKEAGRNTVTVFEPSPAS